jgi:phosphatidate cytidylyltransferase
MMDSFLTLVTVIVGLLAVAPVAILAASRRVSASDKQELWARYRSWLYLALALVLPIALGPVTTVLGVGLLSLLCYREFARMSGLFRERRLSIIISLGTLALVSTSIYHNYAAFVAVSVLILALIAGASTSDDHPDGYLQRTALAAIAWSLIVWLNHLGLLTAHANYRSLILWLILCVELNDVFAFIFGRLIGGPKLAPQVSPGKTVAGAAGALGATTLLCVLTGSLALAEATLLSLLVLGLIIGSAGQLGDLIVSAIKRDIGVKDCSQLIPGHGGCLDRFDSLLLVAPAVFFVLHFTYIGGLTT